MEIDIAIVNQEPSSPDHNNLGFFASIQALQQEETANDFSQLIDNVTNAFAEYHTRKTE